MYLFCKYFLILILAKASLIQVAFACESAVNTMKWTLLNHAGEVTKSNNNCNIWMQELTNKYIRCAIYRLYVYININRKHIHYIFSVPSSPVSSFNPDIILNFRNKKNYMFFILIFCYQIIILNYLVITIIIYIQ